MDAQRLGVLGGTFDPFHIGHLTAASAALDAFELDRVLFVPTGRPWQKARYSDPEDRFLMTVLGVSSHPSFAVSRLELDRKGPTYTVDTIAALRDFYGPDADLYFIAGADAVLRLETWHRPEALKELADVIAITRPGFDLAHLEVPESWPVVHVVTIDGVDVSASEIRERVRLGRPLGGLVPAEVAVFVRERGLYARDGAARTAAGGSA